MKKTISFFMLVTNRDLMISDYAIQSFKKLTLYNYTWKLIIFLNCLTPKNEQYITNKWSSEDFIEIISEKNIPDGYVNPRGPMLDPSDVWTKYFYASNSDYWCQVDSDFEIIRPDFIEKIFSLFDKYSALKVISANSSPDILCHESFSGETKIVKQRLHTWFCIYSKDCKVCRTGFYFQQFSEGNLKWCYDHAGYLQHTLAKEYNFQMISIDSFDSTFAYDYIHYMAFSKNRSINTRLKTAIYRFIVKASKLGAFSLINPHKLSPRTYSILNFINFFYKKIFSQIYKLKYQKISNERTIYTYDNPLDKN